MAMTLITTNTSSDAATSDFTTGIDNTYKLYIFKFYDVNPATDGVIFQFQANAVGASDYNEEVTTTQFSSSHNEDDSGGTLGYLTGRDQAQGTSFMNITHSMGNAADEGCAGELFLFNPSNTTYVKHFHSVTNGYYEAAPGTIHFFAAGYINTTAAIDDIQFKMSSGNMDGVIKMYGVG